LPADHTPARKDEIQEITERHMASRYGRRCDVSVPTL